MSEAVHKEKNVLGGPLLAQSSPAPAKVETRLLTVEGQVQVMPVGGGIQRRRPAPA